MLAESSILQTTVNKLEDLLSFRSDLY